MKRTNIFRSAAFAVSMAGAMSLALSSCGGSHEGHDHGDHEGEEHHEGDGHDHAEVAAHKAVHWAYDGETGPAHWATLCGDYSGCSGSHQSPIDLTSAEMNEGLGELMTSYAESPNFAAVNNGHTVQVNISAQGKLTVEGKEYSLKQFHFHTTSEHTIDGAKFPMEMHLVHLDDSSNIAVVGVVFEEGAENPFLASFIDALPAKAETDTLADLSFSLANLFPADMSYFRYAGSLTTPPCSEGVVWTVLKTPVTASKAQIEKMASMMPKENARPVQKLNDRKVYSN